MRDDTRSVLRVGGREHVIYRLDAFAGVGVGRLPYSLRVLLENVLRCGTQAEAEAVAGWRADAEPAAEVAFNPGRVLLHDTTGVPALVDLASMRDAMRELGGDPARVRPTRPAVLVVDHSLQVEAFAQPGAMARNVEIEYERNLERYRFLRWGQSALDGFQVVPPNTGIMHQVNIEKLCTVVAAHDGVAFPDTLVGADSHTTMANGIGVLAWGVGGIEAGAAMLGEPLPLLVPQVVGVRLLGALPEGATATDLVLRATELLRSVGVVGRFVEYIGEGLGALPVADRVTLANMSPEYGATCGFFPVDARTLEYLRLTGRNSDQVALVEAYCKENLLWHEPGSEQDYTRVVELDLGSIEPSLAGPRRPQDRVALRAVRDRWAQELDSFGAGYADGSPEEGLAETFPASDPTTEQAPGATPHPSTPPAPRAPRPSHRGPVPVRGAGYALDDGSVVIAAITSCTNTSNPTVMVGAGLLARNAVARGLRRRPWVKSSLAPGSRTVSKYLARAGLDRPLDELGFQLVGYGCTTCIGASGPLPEPVSEAVAAGDLAVCAVLSGNRNFEARIHPDVKANFLASPPLVVAYALAGRIDVDLTREPLGQDPDGQDVFLRDVWPDSGEIERTIAATIGSDLFEQAYADLFAGDEHWQSIGAAGGSCFAWDPASTYVRRAPHFAGMTPEPEPVDDIAGARCLAVLGDSITTDHLSPAGAIRPDSPAGAYLLAQGVQRRDFNTHATRRGNHEVMVRAAFGNVRLRNRLVDREGPWTRHLPSGEEMTVYDAAMRYREEGVPTIVLAGRDYGTGSSRDWGAKGPRLLGVRAVLAESYERIHRSNLLMMGVLPLQFEPGASAASLGLTGEERYDIRGLAGGAADRVEIVADGVRFSARVRLDTERERAYFRHGGILPFVLRRLLAEPAEG
jgi:aconitate hydratase